MATPTAAQDELAPSTSPRSMASIASVDAGKPLISLNFVPINALSSRGTVSASEPGPVPARMVSRFCASAIDCVFEVCHCMKMLLEVATRPI